MKIDLEKFDGALPYASEIYGVYQPLIGWKSRLIAQRVSGPVQLPQYPREITIQMVSENPGDNGTVFDQASQRDVFFLNPDTVRFSPPGYIDSLSLRFMQGDIAQAALDYPTEDEDKWFLFWQSKFETKPLQELYDKSVRLTQVWVNSTMGVNVAAPLPDSPMKTYLDRIGAMLPLTADLADFQASAQAFLEYVLNKEIYVARYLHEMATANPKRLNTMLQAALRVPSAQDILRALDPSYLAPSSGRDAVFSPVGILHLYRQSFFEFATFLGVPVEHLWLAPGSTTELIEASTRRTLTERSFEQVAETILRSETAQTSEDELSSAIKAENTNDTKMGSSLKGGVNILIISAEASGDISNQQTQKKAREENHRQMRQQSAKASSEIRNNFKSTFRTVTEVTDTRSKRYVIANTSSQLVNYELRRKMRQVGVQTQDAGTQLCWQLYVDDAGKDLGVAELVHLASKADLAQYPTLPMMTEPKAIPTVVNINLVVPTPGKGTGLTASVAAGAIGFVAGGGVPGAVVGVGIKEIYDDLFGDGDDDTDAYGINTVNKIVQQYKVNMPNGYQMADAANQPIDDDDFKRNDDNPPVVPSLGDFPIRWSHKNGKNINWRAKIMNEAEGTFELVVDRGEATPKEIIEFQASIKLVPTTDAITNVKNMNAANLLKNKETDVAKLRAIKDEFIKTVKERVKLASAIKTRKVEDLREEERTVIYRNLVSLLMREAWSSAASRPMAHLRSELVKSIFDVDRMLYFVAPEWWQPRLHQSKQGVGSELPENELSRLNPASQAAIERAGKDSRFNARAGNAASKGLGTLDNMDTVSWGGAGRTDNYLITEDSEPAKLGASLGWLLQLDGDNLRNAFLNAPWVKAIVPIRPGKEREALEWLMQSQVEGADGLNEPYGGTEPKLQGLTVQQALFQLADEINAKYENGCVVQQEDVTELGDGQPPVKRNIFYLPSERVFERGFDPLKDGFRAEPDKAYEIIDQWIEIMPTDQIVAVDVKYDPKTGQQL